ncbi:MAG: trimethylamine methyltransferase family protein [Deltaproteobacteria bacterium]|jgi:trimethylamine--corrinoid protein Co-methyltransferase|nr:trimethylamine methyltransferase family protein [Deltaproteobacteria bacterium]
MTISSIQVCRPRYRLLSAGQIDRIHTATLQLLETVGVSIRHQGARDMLAGAGCRVRNDKTVLIPAQLVADAIQSAPSEVVIYNRLGEKALHLEGRRIHFGPGTDLARVCDLDTGRLRTSTLKDVQAAVRIADALPEIDFIASYVIPNDSPPHLLYLDAFKVQLEHSTKPILFTAAGLEDIRSITEMAVAVAGSRDNLRRKPFVIHYSEPLSPLVHNTGAVEKLLFSADHHIPVIYTPGIMSGATGPVTLAGALVMGNAEALSGLVIHQLRSKGAPIISGIGMAVMDMARSTCIYGCPESRLILSACADLYHHYGVPVWGTAGVTDANCLDLQAGMEWGDSLLLNAMAGVNLIHDVGYMGQGLVGHPAALVVCDEIISYTRRMMRGFILDDAHVDLDAIGRVGAGGSFLSTRQTARLFKSEHWYPNLCNRDSVGAWQKNGSQDMAARAVEKARDILRIPPVEAIEASLQKELDNIRSRAEKS